MALKEAEITQLKKRITLKRSAESTSRQMEKLGYDMSATKRMTLRATAMTKALRASGQIRNKRRKTCIHRLALT